MPPDDRSRPVKAAPISSAAGESSTPLHAVLAALLAADLDGNRAHVLLNRLRQRRALRRYGGPSSWEDLVEQAEDLHQRGHRDGRLQWADRFLTIRDALVDRMEAAS